MMANVFVLRSLSDGEFMYGSDSGSVRWADRNVLSLTYILPHNRRTRHTLLTERGRSLAILWPRSNMTVTDITLHGVETKADAMLRN